MSKCKHHNHEANVTVNRLEDIGRYHADIQVKCTECGTPFLFIGLPTGLDLNGATVSVDGKEAHLALAPEGEVLTPLDGVRGYTIKRTE